MADQTNAEVSDERLTFDHQQQADNYLEALLGYSGGFYGAAIKAGLPAAETVGPIAHIERAARELHRLALNRRSVTSQASEGEGWQQAVEPFLGLLDPIPVVGDHVEIASLKGDVCDKFVDAALSLTVGEFRALRDASPSKRVERLETALKPFADAAADLPEHIHDMVPVVLTTDAEDNPADIVHIGDFRRALQALGGRS